MDKKDAGLVLITGIVTLIIAEASIFAYCFGDYSLAFYITLVSVPICISCIGGWALDRLIKSVAKPIELAWPNTRRRISDFLDQLEEVDGV